MIMIYEDETEESTGFRWRRGTKLKRKVNEEAIYPNKGGRQRAMRITAKGGLFGGQRFEKHCGTKVQGLSREQ